MPKDVIVADDEYYDASTVIQDYGNSICGLINRYQNVCENILQNAVIDERIKDAFSPLLEQVINTNDRIREVSENASKKSRQFISFVDEADKFIY